MKELSFPWEMHHTVLPGTIGIYCCKGRLRDAEGRPNLYPPGTTIKFQLFAAPPWSDAVQHAIIVSRAAQRVKVTLRYPLPGLAGEPATLATVIRFEVTDLQDTPVPLRRFAGALPEIHSLHPTVDEQSGAAQHLPSPSSSHPHQYRLPAGLPVPAMREIIPVAAGAYAGFCNVLFEDAVLQQVPPDGAFEVQVIRPVADGHHRTALSRFHARGPVGAMELTTIKYVVTGDGQVRE